MDESLVGNHQRIKRIRGILVRIDQEVSTLSVYVS